jgi:hypothetical protein
MQSNLFFILKGTVSPSTGFLVCRMSEPFLKVETKREDDSSDESSSDEEKKKRFSAQQVQNKQAFSKQ